MAKPDLNKLKTEIESRKKERNMTPSTLGESVGYGVAPRDVFLNGLIESLTTGKETVSSTLVKTVDNKVSAKKGENTRLRVDETIQQQPRQHIPPPTTETVDMSPERDEQLFRDLESKRKQTLAESIEGYVKTPTVGAPMRNQPPQQQSAPMNLNEQYLAENVKKIVNNYLIENFGPILEEAIKDTMLEIYAMDRIKSALTELVNKDTIKPLVFEVIKDIQAKSKQNKVQ
jgi:hypothetical protein